MALELFTALQAGSVYSGSETFDVAAGKAVIIETSPSGVEILNKECPAGKEWNVTVSITIRETDA